MQARSHELKKKKTELENTKIRWEKIRNKLHRSILKKKERQDKIIDINLKIKETRRKLKYARSILKSKKSPVSPLLSSQAPVSIFLQVYDDEDIFVGDTIVKQCSNISKIFIVPFFLLRHHPKDQIEFRNKTQKRIWKLIINRNTEWRDEQIYILFPQDNKFSGVKHGCVKAEHFEYDSLEKWNRLLEIRDKYVKSSSSLDTTFEKVELAKFEKVDLKKDRVIAYFDKLKDILGIFIENKTEYMLQLSNPYVYEGTNFDSIKNLIKKKTNTANWITKWTICAKSNKIICAQSNPDSGFCNIQIGFKENDVFWHDAGTDSGNPYKAVVNDTKDDKAFVMIACGVRTKQELVNYMYDCKFFDRNFLFLRRKIIVYASKWSEQEKHMVIVKKLSYPDDPVERKYKINVIIKDEYIPSHEFVNTCKFINKKYGLPVGITGVNALVSTLREGLLIIYCCSNPYTAKLWRDWLLFVISQEPLKPKPDIESGPNPKLRMHQVDDLKPKKNNDMEIKMKCLTQRAYEILKKWTFEERIKCYQYFISNKNSLEFLIKNHLSVDNATVKHPTNENILPTVSISSTLLFLTIYEISEDELDVFRRMVKACQNNRKIFILLAFINRMKENLNESFENKIWLFVDECEKIYNKKVYISFPHVNYIPTYYGIYSQYMYLEINDEIKTFIKDHSYNEILETYAEKFEDVVITNEIVIKYKTPGHTYSKMFESTKHSLTSSDGKVWSLMNLNILNASIDWKLPDDVEIDWLEELIYDFSSQSQEDFIVNYFKDKGNFLLSRLFLKPSQTLMKPTRAVVEKQSSVSLILQVYDKEDIFVGNHIVNQCIYKSQIFIVPYFVLPNYGVVPDEKTQMFLWGLIKKYTERWIDLYRTYIVSPYAFHNTSSLISSFCVRINSYYDSLENNNNNSVDAFNSLKPEDRLRIYFGNNRVIAYVDNLHHYAFDLLGSKTEYVFNVSNPYIYKSKNMSMNNRELLYRMAILGIDRSNEWIVHTERSYAEQKDDWIPIYHNMPFEKTITIGYKKKDAFWHHIGTYADEFACDVEFAYGVENKKTLDKYLNKHKHKEFDKYESIYNKIIIYVGKWDETESRTLNATEEKKEKDGTFKETKKVIVIKDIFIPPATENECVTIAYGVRTRQDLIKYINDCERFNGRRLDEYFIAKKIKEKYQKIIIYVEEWSEENRFFEMTEDGATIEIKDISIPPDELISNCMFINKQYGLPVGITGVNALVQALRRGLLFTHCGSDKYTKELWIDWILFVISNSSFGLRDDGEVYKPDYSCDFCDSDDFCYGAYRLLYDMSIENRIKMYQDFIMNKTSLEDLMKEFLSL